MFPFDLRSKEFIGVIVPSPQVSVSNSGSSLKNALTGNLDSGSYVNYMQIAPILFNASFDPKLRAMTSILSSLDNAFSSALSSLKTSGVLAGTSSEEIANSMKSGATYPSSPIDFNGGGARYLVHIPEIMPFINSLDGIWCHSGVPSSQVNPNKAKEATISNSLLEPIGKLFGTAASYVTNLIGDVQTIAVEIGSIGVNAANMFGSIAALGKSAVPNSINAVSDVVSSLTVLEPFIELQSRLSALSDDEIDRPTREAIDALAQLAKHGTDNNLNIDPVLLYKLRQADVDDVFEYIDLVEDSDSLRILERAVSPQLFSNIADALESKSFNSFMDFSALAELGGWGIEFGIDDVMSKATEIVGEVADGALGMVSGGFLNFTLNSGAEMSPTVGDSASGTYIPLNPGMKVVIRFMENDLNSGQILRVLPYDSQIGPHYSKYKSTHDDMQDLYPQLYQK